MVQTEGASRNVLAGNIFLSNSESLLLNAQQQFDIKIKSPAEKVMIDSLEHLFPHKFRARLRVLDMDAQQNFHERVPSPAQYFSCKGFGNCRKTDVLPLGRYEAINISLE